MESPLLGAAREIPSLGRAGSVFGLASLFRLPRGSFLTAEAASRDWSARRQGIIAAALRGAKLSL
jgi:hypothetical protein